MAKKAAESMTDMSYSEPAQASQPEAKAAKPAYSYGLRCSLGNEELKKLGIEKLPATGEELEASVRFKVMGTSSEGEGEDARHNVSLQITHMDLEGADEDDEEEGGEAKAGKLFGGKAQEEGETGE